MHNTARANEVLSAWVQQAAWQYVYDVLKSGGMHRGQIMRRTEVVLEQYKLALDEEDLEITRHNLGVLLQGYTYSLAIRHNGVSDYVNDRIS